MSETARKPFNLQEALAGKPVVTRDGRKVLSIAQLPTLTTTRYTLFAHIDGDDYGKGFTADGLYIAGVTSSDDLFMAPNTLWLNLYRAEGALAFSGWPYKTEGEANEAAGPSRVGKAIPVVLED